jgi:hypothetical protein
MGAKRQLAAPKIALVAMLSWVSGAWGTGATDWDDVCTSPEISQVIREDLCPNVFLVSTLAFDPMLPFAESYVTLILQPSVPLSETESVSLTLPDFDPIGVTSVTSPTNLELIVTPNNPQVVGNPNSYNTAGNPVFDTTGLYDTTTGYIKLTINPGKTLNGEMDTEVTICCMRLPSSSPANNQNFKISAPPASGTGDPTIAEEPLKNSPYIDPGFQWEFLHVAFTPPIAQHTTVISLTLRSANDLGAQAQIIVYLNRVTRTSGGTGYIEFNTLLSADVDDWMFFSHLAEWDSDDRKLRFYLREGKVLPAGRPITISTVEGDFYLAEEMEANWDQIQVEARSYDDVDEIIKATPVMQSSRVPPVRKFLYSELVYHLPEPNAMTDVTLIFRTNRPMYAGSAIYLRLSGFQARVIEVPLLGIIKVHFLGEMARFRLPENQLELNVNLTLYSNEQDTEITFHNLFLPPALYANDSSLIIWNSDAGAEHQSIGNSPAIGGGLKNFSQAQIKFNPATPNLESNITFILRPSIPFYQSDQIVMNLYPFLCSQNHLPLVGPGAIVIEDSFADWDPVNYTLTFTVAANQIITISEPLTVGIGMVTRPEDNSENYPCRLPDKLSQNDGTLRVESKGALIYMEPMKKVPKIGDDKFVIQSRIEFEPAVSLYPETRIRFKFVLNCDVMPGTRIYMKLGAMLHNSNVPTESNPGEFDYMRSGIIQLSGHNAPLFNREGYWDQEEVTLTLQVIPDVWIYSGETIRFFIEKDQNFKLPVAMYGNDESFIIEIMEAGIAAAPFQFSTKVNEEPKQFIESEIYYGEAQGDVAYPNTMVAMNMRFRANVDLPGGSIIRFILPGFQLPNETVTLGSMQGKIFLGEYDLNNLGITGTWDQFSYSLAFEVPPNQGLDRTKTTVFTIPQLGGFQLPDDMFTKDDPRLKIASIANQIIREEPIKTSPIVVTRTFIHSELEYQPAVAGSICLILMTLRPTVNITNGQDIVIKFARFSRNILFLTQRNIHIMGRDRYRITDSMGQWNETTETLTMSVPIGAPIPANTTLLLRIEESQGFQLPQFLDQNDPAIRIWSRGFGNPTDNAPYNIPNESIKISQMVGNGPFVNPQQLYCMYQYEHGVRTVNPICTCDPPLENPCSSTELARCNCESKLDKVRNLTVYGFNLQASDQIFFLPQGSICSVDGMPPEVLNAFSQPTHKVVSAGTTVVGGMELGTSHVEFVGISSIDTGYFEVCVIHVNKVYQIGKIVVRPSCTRPYVRVQGTCVEHCPKTKVPIAGECRLDPYALADTERQAVMLPVRMTSDGELVQVDLGVRPSYDSELRYFIYRYTYEMARLLNADPQRIEVASISNGTGQSVIVNTVFTTVGDEEALAASTERSPRGLVSLLQALQADTSSSLYMSTFFKSIDQVYVQEPVAVRQCPSGDFRVYCPFKDDIWQYDWTMLWFGVGMVSVPLVLGFVCICLWKIDSETKAAVDDDILEKVRRNPNLVDPPLQAEYAKSWLEGRFMGEDWEVARHAKLLSIGNHSKGDNKENS